jgi:hypothetical protein
MPIYSVDDLLNHLGTQTGITPELLKKDAYDEVFEKIEKRSAELEEEQLRDMGADRDTYTEQAEAFQRDRDADYFSKEPI